MSGKDKGELVLGGGSGMIGTALIPIFQAKGWQVRKLVRSSTDATSTDHEIPWFPDKNMLDPRRLGNARAVIHLGGANVADGAWTSKRKEIIRASRVASTRLLSETLASMEQPPEVFVCASAIGIYGDRGDTLLSEEANPGNDFLASVCEQWEAATLPAQEAGIRVVNARIGVVLAKEGGALAKMLTPFKLGLGGKVGSGRQYWSWIDMDDVVQALVFCVEQDHLCGPVNLVAPEPVPNLHFVKAFGKYLGRPAVMPLPGFMVSMMMGEMGRALLLASTRVSSEKLTNAGYRFQYPTLAGSLEHVLNT